MCDYSLHLVASRPAPMKADQFAGCDWLAKEGSRPALSARVRALSSG